MDDLKCKCGSDYFYTDVVEDLVIHVCKSCGEQITEGEEDGDLQDGPKDRGSGYDWDEDLYPVSSSGGDQN